MKPNTKAAYGAIAMTAATISLFQDFLGREAYLAWLANQYWVPSWVAVPLAFYVFVLGARMVASSNTTQPAKAMDPITDFRGRYRWLSNFHPCMVTLDGETYPSVEHAYVAAKTLDPEIRAVVRNLEKPSDAKKYGRTIVLRPDWEDVKLEVMTDLLYQKFAPHTALCFLLLSTGDAELVEGNVWNDTFWGICRGVGENHLGRILMEIRAELETRYP